VTRARSVLLASAAIAIALWSLAPWIWLLVTSLTPAAEIGSLQRLLPSQLVLDSYRSVFLERPFLRIVANSLAVAGASTFLSLLLGAPAAFALTRLPIPGKGLVLGLFVSVSMFPTIAAVAPVHLAMQGLGLRDTLAGLVLPYAALELPLVVWFLHGFFLRVPRDLYRAARIDGCTPLQAFRRVFLPLALPGLATTAVLGFTFSWNEFLFALTLTTTERSRTVPVEIALFAGLHEVPWGEISAAAIVATIPVIAVAVFFQRRIVAGLVAGATKG
jgi:multiple sugar transport system permease protein